MAWYQLTHFLHIDLIFFEVYALFLLTFIRFFCMNVCAEEHQCLFEETIICFYLNAGRNEHFHHYVTAIVGSNALLTLIIALDPITLLNI